MQWRTLIQFNYNNIIILYFRGVVNDPCKKRTAEAVLFQICLFFLSHIQKSDNDGRKDDIDTKFEKEVEADKSEKDIRA